MKKIYFENFLKLSELILSRSDIISINIENQELIGHQIYIKNYQFYLLYEIFKNRSYTKIETFANKIIFKLQLILCSIYLQTNNYPYNLIHDCIMNRKLFRKLYNQKNKAEFMFYSAY